MIEASFVILSLMLVLYFAFILTPHAYMARLLRLRGWRYSLYRHHLEQLEKQVGQRERELNELRQELEIIANSWDVQRRSIAQRLVEKPNLTDAECDFLVRYGYMLDPKPPTS